MLQDEATAPEKALWSALWKKPQAVMWKRQGLEFQVANYVRTYLEALDSHDCARAGSLWADAPEEVEQWCHDLAGVDAVRVRPSFVEPDGAHPGTQEVVDVPVTLELDHRPFRGDGTMDGTTVWGYQLTRATGPWRIVGQGAG